jgi:hypothetical protein
LGDQVGYRHFFLADDTGNGRVNFGELQVQLGMRFYKEFWTILFPARGLPLSRRSGGILRFKRKVSSIKFELMTRVCR